MNQWGACTLLLAKGAPPSSWETLVTALLPVVAFVLVAPALWLVFGRTWRELDTEAHLARAKTLIAGRFDARPAVLFTTTAAVLALQEYYGGRRFYAEELRPVLAEVQARELWPDSGLDAYVDILMYDELYSYAWWTFARVFGYVVIPLVVWKLCFRKESILDMGLRVRGILDHAWIYLLCLGVVVPAVFIVANGPDFGSYYPFYKKSSRSWLDFLAWEAMYIAQFFGLEVFFRGFWLTGLRKNLGSGAIFAMCVPYTMIHYGKPYLETMGAMIAGVALGSLAMKTRSIYLGFLVHITIALLMDFVSLNNQGKLPVDLVPLP